jgi:hypothetical protein
VGKSKSKRRLQADHEKFWRSAKGLAIRGRQEVASKSGPVKVFSRAEIEAYARGQGAKRTDEFAEDCAMENEAAAAEEEGGPA